MLLTCRTKASTGLPAKGPGPLLSHGMGPPEG